MQGVTDGYCHGRAAHGRCQRTYCILGIIDSREQKSPCAIAPSASIPYLFREISISFRFRNALNFSIFKLSPYPDPLPAGSVPLFAKSLAYFLKFLADGNMLRTYFLTLSAFYTFICTLSAMTDYQPVFLMRCGGFISVQLL